jgi:hypothetical protein
MISKKDCIIGVITAYVFLIMLYFLLQKQENIKTPCGWEEPCVRFCCNDTRMCKDSFIRKNFQGNFTDVDETNSTVDFIVLHGAPTCKLNDYGTGERSFVHVSLSSKITFYHNSI